MPAGSCCHDSAPGYTRWSLQCHCPSGQSIHLPYYRQSIFPGYHLFLHYWVSRKKRYMRSTGKKTNFSSSFENLGKGRAMGSGGKQVSLGKNPYQECGRCNSVLTGTAPGNQPGIRKELLRIVVTKYKNRLCVYNALHRGNLFWWQHMRRSLRMQ